MVADIDAILADDAVTRVRIDFGHVYIETPSYPNERRDVWTVWDPRPVSQGARCVAYGLTYEEARALALDIT